MYVHTLTAVASCISYRDVTANFLPPPHDLDISLVKLLTHSTYLIYQNNVATLSLFPSVYVKYLPPQWNATSETSEDGKSQSEWKKKVKMFCECLSFAQLLTPLNFSLFLSGTRR